MSRPCVVEWCVRLRSDRTMVRFAYLERGSGKGVVMVLLVALVHGDRVPKSSRAWKDIRASGDVSRERQR